MPQGRDPGDQAFSSLSEISDDARRNREDWTKANAEYTDARARSNWAAEEITWSDAFSADWSRKWPAEEIWVATKSR